ncbi:MAG TPA: recombinase family protein [Candidatus Binatia bacterium]|nr:recombinase family protein [Candidatus Binatia bacterium]
MRNARTVVGYARVSTVGQANDGVSLEAQRAGIERWAADHQAELADVFVDAGVSGKRADNRPELQRALAAVCRARGVLVVYSLSRLARSTRDAIEIAERLRKAGAHLVSLTESIDTTSATGKLVFQVLAVLAEFERNLCSERTAAALAHKRARGERVSRFAPYGWRFGDEGELEPVAAEQDAIGEMVTMRRAGASLRRISDSLAVRGFVSRSGGRLGPKTIRDAVLRAGAASAAVPPAQIVAGSAGAVEGGW